MPVDIRGVPVSSCAAESLDDFETALIQFHSYFGDPIEILSTTLKNDPEFVLGYIFNASAMLMMSECQYIPEILRNIEKAEALSHKSNNREKALIVAARHWVEGRLDKACLVLDRVLEDHPRDALTIQITHLTDFFRADAFNLRDRIGRVLGHWNKDTPSYSYILGMQAFGFEECNQYDLAEQTAYAALEIEPRDGWTVHALGHVFEMRGQYEEGISMYRSRESNWAPDNGLAYHNWWHLALYHIEHEDFSGAVNLYDQQLIPEDSDISLQMLDASALLWRLHLQGVELGSRWNRLAELWAKKTPVENGYYAFNDLHAVIAFVGSDRIADAQSVLKAVEVTAQRGQALTSLMAREVGVPTCKAMIDFGLARYDDVIEGLLPIRTIANRFGGSHAQRDILTQTLIEAAIRGGRKGLACNLINERMVHKPFSPLSKRFRNKQPI